MGATGKVSSASNYATIPSGNTMAPPVVNQGQGDVTTQAPNASNTQVVSNGLANIANMTDAELAQLVRDSMYVNLPNYLNDASDLTQRFVFQAGLNEKPMVLDRADFDNFIKDNNINPNEVLNRSINVGKYTNQMNTSINLTPNDIADMLKYSRFNYIGGKFGGKAYGAGTYFAATGARNIGVNTGYGGSNSTTISAVLNPKTAKVVSYYQLSRLASNFAQTHPQFAKAVGKFSMGTNGSIYALAMGYNVIADKSSGNSGGDYVNVIDRSALVYLK